jgi:hypothetical protein
MEWPITKLAREQKGEMPPNNKPLHKVGVNFTMTVINGNE